MKPWLYLGGAIALFALVIGAYFFGRDDGASIEIAKQSAIEAAVRAERDKREDLVDAGAAAGAAKEAARRDTVSEIYHETQRILDRPVYRDRCIDADGVQLLDRAAGAANGEDPAGPAGEAAQAPPGPAPD